jgi:glycosyltransferase involved in cell wall biosynthesis
MSKIPQITIITPVYNGLPYIKECIDSVLAQDFQDWEMLISDDGSTDGTRDYLKTIKDTRIQVFFQQQNLGIFGNLNFLFKNAQAEISQILCQDDYFIESGSLFLIVNYWNTVPLNVGFVRFNKDVVGQCHLSRYFKKISPEIINLADATLWFYLFGNILGNLSNVSLRTKVIEKSGWFREDMPYTGDFEFWSRASRQYNIGLQNTLVVLVRRHPGVASIYLNKKGEFIVQNAKVVGELYKEVLNNYPHLTFSLKLHGTLNYDILQRDAALKQWIRGNHDYYYELEKVSNSVIFTMALPIKWILYFLTFGGRIGRVMSAKIIQFQIS